MQSPQTTLLSEVQKLPVTTATTDQIYSSKDSEDFPAPNTPQQTKLLLNSESPETSRSPLKSENESTNCTPSKALQRIRSFTYTRKNFAWRCLAYVKILNSMATTPMVVMVKKLDAEIMKMVKRHSFDLYPLDKRVSDEEMKID